MIIQIQASASQQAEWQAKPVPTGIRFLFNQPVLPADAYFDLCYETSGPAFNEIRDQPVFVNAVAATGQSFPENYIRLNAWPGFLARPIWEIAAPAHSSFRHQADAVLTAMQQPFQWVPDQPGFLAARVIATIINEAFYAWGEGVSSRDNIDTAMKLGTNYPAGPFEWMDKIGAASIVQLLKAMAIADDRYQPAPALLQSLQASGEV
ncbi:MAG TPA: 3-hydroxyacyl-CoA dehydrogenase family protein [Sediminibacterium sp.]|nr:3-hydroxyacyl-CoA dehydrogenase family protein [Sediminibacterium sp.]